MDEIGMKERTREPGRPSVLPLRLSVVSPQSIIDSGFRRTVEPLSTPFPTFSFPSSPRVWNFNKISEIPILFHARDPPLGETLEGRTIKETRSLLLSPRDPFSLILGPFRFLSSPRGTRYSRLGTRSGNGRLSKGWAKRWRTTEERALEWPGYYGIVTREGKVLVWKSAKSARRSKRILSNFDFQVHPS